MKTKPVATKKLPITENELAVLIPALKTFTRRLRQTAERCFDYEASTVAGWIDDAKTAENILDRAEELQSK